MLNMVPTLSNLNANSVVLLLNGFVGVILISANLATKNNVVEIMYREKQKTNFRNVVVKRIVR